MTILCSKCGTSNDVDSLYCGSCGTRLSSSQASSPPPDQPGKLTLLRTIRIPRFVELLKVKRGTIAKTPGMISRIQLSKAGESRILRSIPRRIPRIAAPVEAKMDPLAETNGPFSSAPSSELRNPTKKISTILSHAFSAFEKFSSLPLWLTMPLIFGCSFALGAIVTLLIRI